MKLKSFQYMADLKTTVTSMSRFIFYFYIVMLTTARFNPGPGAYEPKTSISANGNYLIAGFKNSKAPTFSLPAMSAKAYGRKDNSPGPGAYNLKTGISDTPS
jgi:hypothetical protein